MAAVFVDSNGPMAIADASALLDALVVHVFPIARDDIAEAHAVALAQRRLPGRDGLHVAVMRRQGIRSILTADRDFDLWPGIERLPAAG